MKCRAKKNFATDPNQSTDPKPRIHRQCHQVAACCGLEGLEFAIKE